MGKRTIVPFGPQHPVLPEPIHLDLVLDDETVVEAIPSIGFVHRGLEKLAEKRDFQEYVYVAERICGICSFMHGMGYCMAVENIMGLKVPDRAEFLRVIWSELSRIHSHLLWLGLMADAVGYESLFQHSWRMREQILDLFDMTTGGRVIFSVCKVGGVRKDVSAEKIAKILDVLHGMERELRSLTDVFNTDKSLYSRLAGVGTLSAADAEMLGAVGPMARASGIKTDCRTQGYSAYSYVKFDIPTEREGDSLARVKVRVRELYESIKIIEQCAELIPNDETIAVPVKGFPTGEWFARLEQPRGEVLYYAKGNGTKFLSRVRVRTPTFANLPALVHMLKGVDLADVPVLILTIDPCISCTER
ncbi:NADH dehydrogenase [Clostridia bacterium]|nr:NADH dehydrogenase [Clostridia bacterium]